MQVKRKAYFFLFLKEKKHFDKKTALNAQLPCSHIKEFKVLQRRKFFSFPTFRVLTSHWSKYGVKTINYSN